MLWALQTKETDIQNLLMEFQKWAFSHVYVSVLMSLDVLRSAFSFSFRAYILGRCYKNAEIKFMEDEWF